MKTKGKLPICIFAGMDMHDARRDNLRILLKSNTFAEINRRTGVPASYLSSAFKQLPDGRYLKNIGEKIARKIEVGMKLPMGWLDQAHGANRHMASESLTTYSATTKPSSSIEGAIEVIRVALMNVDGLTRAQAKPIIDALFADPENSQNLGARMAATLEINADTPPKREAA